MKKLLSLLLALVMLISLAVPAFASCEYNYNEKTGEHSEMFGFTSGFKGNTYYGRNINLVANNHSSGALLVGDKYYANFYVQEDKNYYITRVEAKISSYPGGYAGLAVEPGTKRDVGNVTWDTVVYIDDINSTEFSFLSGDGYVAFYPVTVYYKEGTPPTASTISEGNIWIAVAVGAVAVVAIAAVVIAKKKKKK